jgi:hypothetical protein
VSFGCWSGKVRRPTDTDLAEVLVFDELAEEHTAHEATPSGYPCSRHVARERTAQSTPNYDRKTGAAL